MTCWFEGHEDTMAAHDASVDDAGDRIDRGNDEIVAIEEPQECIQSGQGASSRPLRHRPVLT